MTENLVLLRVVERPVGFLHDIDAIERRLGQEHLAGLDQLRQVPVEKSEQQRRDVVTVGIRVGEQDHLPVAHPGQVEGPADTAAERGDEVGELLVLQHLGGGDPFVV